MFIDFSKTSLAILSTACFLRFSNRALPTRNRAGGGRRSPSWTLYELEAIDHTTKSRDHNLAVRLHRDGITTTR
jgi:hypothetical protein